MTASVSTETTTGSFTTCPARPLTPTSPDELYGAAYYQSGNYHDYLKRGPKYAELAAEMVSWLTAQGVGRGPLLDFGCGVGHLVAGLNRCEGVRAYGYDPSSWAVNYGRQVLGNKRLYDLLTTVMTAAWQLLIALDVFEHMDLADVLETLKRLHPDFLAIRVPVSRMDGRPYILPCSERDLTHRLRLSKTSWAAILEAAGYREIARPDLKYWWDAGGVYCALFGKHADR